MPSAPASLGRKLGPLPLWGWGAVLAAGLGVVVLLRRRSSSVPAGSTGALPAADYSPPPSIGGNPSVIEAVPPAVADALVGQNAALGAALVGQGQSLAGVALGAQDALAQIASYGMSGAFGLAQTAVASESMLAASVAASSFNFAGQALSSYPAGGAAPTAAPAPRTSSLPSYSQLGSTFSRFAGGGGGG